MEWPKSSQELGNLIEEQKLFELGRSGLISYLHACYEDNPWQFQEVMRADLETVMNTYRFRNKIIALNKNYCFDPPEDYLSVNIAIDDGDGDYVCSYTLCLDLELNVIDDMMGM